MAIINPTMRAPIQRKDRYKKPMDHLPPRTQYIVPAGATIPTAGWYEMDGERAVKQIEFATYTTASTGTITYTQDLTWNGWVVGNTTTGTSTYITDEQLVRFEGTGITWDQQFRVNADGWAGECQKVVFDRWQVMHEREVPSPEELQRRADEAQRYREQESRRRLEREQRAAKIEEDRILAQIKGLELLHMLLTDEQRAQYDLNGVIPVVGSLGGRYEIETLYGGVHGNISMVDEHGCRLGRVCVAPAMRVAGGPLPMADGWVGQLMAIKTDEQTFRDRGNWSSRQHCQHPDVPILGQAA